MIKGEVLWGRIQAQNLAFFVVNHHVVGLDVAVHDPIRVRELKRDEQLVDVKPAEQQQGGSFVNEEKDDSQTDIAERLLLVNEG